MDEPSGYYTKWKKAITHSQRQILNDSTYMGLPDSSVGKESTHNAGDPGSIPGSGRSPGEGKGYSLQYSGLENFHGLYSPWDCRESDTIERLSLSFTRLSISWKENTSDLYFDGWISDCWEQACSGHILARAVQQESGDVRTLNSTIPSLVVHE